MICRSFSMSLRNLVIFVLPTVAHLKIYDQTEFGKCREILQSSLLQSFGYTLELKLVIFFHACYLKQKLTSKSNCPPKWTPKPHCLLDGGWVGSMESRSPVQFPCLGKWMALFSVGNAQEMCLKPLPHVWDMGQQFPEPRTPQVMNPGTRIALHSPIGSCTLVPVPFPVPNSGV